MTRDTITDKGHAPRRRCLYCDKPFVTYRNGHQKYCSQECARRSNRPFVREAFDYSLRIGPAEHDSKTAPRATPKPVEIRRVRAEDGKRYYARDADALLEEISDAEQARPGLLYG